MKRQVWKWTISRICRVHDRVEQLLLTRLLKVRRELALVLFGCPTHVADRISRTSTGKAMVHSKNLSQLPKIKRVMIWFLLRREKTLTRWTASMLKRSHISNPGLTCSTQRGASRRKTSSSQRISDEPSEMLPRSSTSNTEEDL